jgi:hypothetical protein
VGFSTTPPLISLSDPFDSLVIRLSGPIADNIHSYSVINHAVTEAIIAVVSKLGYYFSCQLNLPTLIQILLNYPRLLKRYLNEIIPRLDPIERVFNVDTSLIALTLEGYDRYLILIVEKSKIKEVYVDFDMIPNKYRYLLTELFINTL